MTAGSSKPTHGDEVWGSIGVTINTGNFESFRVDAGSKKTVGPDSDGSDEWDELWNEIDEQLTLKIQEAKADLEAK